VLEVAEVLEVAKMVDKVEILVNAEKEMEVCIVVVLLM
jgi:hypothetical protein